MLKIFAYAAPRTGNGSKQWPRPVTNTTVLEWCCRPRRAQTKPDKRQKFARKALKKRSNKLHKKGWDDFVRALIKNWKWVRSIQILPVRVGQGQMAKWGGGEVQRVLLCHVHCLFPSIVIERLWKSRDRNLCNSLTKGVKCFKILNHCCNCIKTINNPTTATSGPYNIHM